MNRGLFLFRLALSFALVVASAGCATLQDFLTRAPKPTIRVSSARFAGFTPRAVQLDVDVEVDNPYTVPLPISEVAAAFSAADHDVLAFQLVPDAPVPAEGRSVVSVPIEIDFSEVLSAVPKVRPGAELSYGVDLDFTFETPVTGPLTLPVRQEGQLWVPAPPRLQVTSFELIERSFTRIRAEVDLVIESENAVALGLDRFDYGLELAGRPVAGGRAAEAERIEADGKVQVTLPVDVRPLDVGRAFVDALTRGRLDVGVKGALELQTPLGPWSVPVAVSTERPIEARGAPSGTD